MSTESPTDSSSTPNFKTPGSPVPPGVQVTYGTPSSDQIAETEDETYRAKRGASPRNFSHDSGCETAVQSTACTDLERTPPPTQTDVNNQNNHNSPVIGFKPSRYIRDAVESTPWHLISGAVLLAAQAYKGARLSEESRQKLEICWQGEAAAKVAVEDARHRLNEAERALEEAVQKRKNEQTNLQYLENRKGENPYWRIWFTLIMEDTRLVILYGSQTGTAQDIAERIWRDGKRFGFRGPVQAMDDYPIAQLIYERLVVFVCSTTGQGEEPDNMKKFWRFLLQKIFQQTHLKN